MRRDPRWDPPSWAIPAGGGPIGQVEDTFKVLVTCNGGVCCLMRLRSTVMVVVCGRSGDHVCAPGANRVGWIRALRPHDLQRRLNPTADSVDLVTLRRASMDAQTDMGRSSSHLNSRSPSPSPSPSHRPRVCRSDAQVHGYHTTRSMVIDPIRRGYLCQSRKVGTNPTHPSVDP